MYFQRCLVVTWLAPRETAAVSARSVYTIQPCTMSRHFRQATNIGGRVHTCSVVTCHLHFWQNDLDLLRATAVTRGWNGYRNESQEQKVDSGEENSSAAPAGTRTRDLSNTSYPHFPGTCNSDQEYYHCCCKSVFELSGCVKASGRPGLSVPNNR